MLYRSVFNLLNQVTPREMAFTSWICWLIKFLEIDGISIVLYTTDLQTLWLYSLGYWVQDTKTAMMRSVYRHNVCVPHEWGELQASFWSGSWLDQETGSGEEYGLLNLSIGRDGCKAEEMAAGRGIVCMPRSLWGDSVRQKKALGFTGGRTQMYASDQQTKGVLQAGEPLRSSLSFSSKPFPLRVPSLVDDTNSCSCESLHFTHLGPISSRALSWPVLWIYLISVTLMPLFSWTLIPITQLHHPTVTTLALVKSVILSISFLHQSLLCTLESEAIFLNCKSDTALVMRSADKLSIHLKSALQHVLQSCFKPGLIYFSVYISSTITHRSIPLPQRMSFWTLLSGLVLTTCAALEPISFSITIIVMDSYVDKVGPFPLCIFCRKDCPVNDNHSYPSILDLTHHRSLMNTYCIEANDTGNDNRNRLRMHLITKITMV